MCIKATQGAFCADKMNLNTKFSLLRAFGKDFYQNKGANF